MKSTMTLVLILLYATSIFAADLNARGHDWLNYTQDEKVAFVEAAYSKLGVTDEAFPPEVIAQNLDMMYKYKAGKGMNTPCIDLVRAMVGRGGKIGGQKQDVGY